MKILCDVCGDGEASLFCCADEAVLCDACDRRVHHANKLAGKHRRFSLLRPDSPLLAPRCDVCQEKRAFLFCQEDRAILCKDCDASIHTANELTKKHSRFLLTGVKLSAEATTPAVDADSSGGAATRVSSSSSSLPEESAASGPVAEDAKKKRVGQPPPPPPATAARHSDSCNSRSVISAEKVPVVQGQGAVDAAGSSDNCSSGTGGSSISDYLMKTLPGWHVEDLLDLPSYYSSSIHTAAAASLSKTQLGSYDDFQPFLEADLEAGGFGAAGNAPSWSVPQVPQVPPTPTTIVFDQGTGISGSNYLHQQSQLQYPNHQHPQHQRWNGDDAFAVPQIISQLPPSGKRARGLWYS